MPNRNALLLVALGFCSLLPMAATAQVPVVEAGGRQGQPAAQSEGNELLLTLYNQLEALKQEVQTLRGMVEETSNQLRRLQNESLDRYVDVDRRLSELSGAGGALPGLTTPGATPDATTFPPAANQLPPNDQQGFNAQEPAGARPPQFNGGPAVVNQAPAPVAGVDSQLGEQDLYRTALNLLLEENKYEESIQLFQAYIDRFPQGRLFTNALYWQGEALILVSRFQEAQAVFTRLINTYPDDPKAAGAMLKLGVVYQQMGDRARAEQTWSDISARYPENVTEIRAAQDYLNRR